MRTIGEKILSPIPEEVYENLPLWERQLVDEWRKDGYSDEQILEFFQEI